MVADRPGGRAAVAVALCWPESGSGLAVELLETRHVRAAFKAMPVKTDRKDARGIAQLMRLGWFRPVHCKSLPAQEVRALLTTRKLLQAKRHDVEMSLRGVLRGFGLKVGPTTPRTFEARVRDLVEHHPTLQTDCRCAAEGARERWRRSSGASRRSFWRWLAPTAQVRCLMTTPGVGAMVALTFTSAIDDPGTLSLLPRRWGALWSDADASTSPARLM